MTKQSFFKRLASLFKDAQAGPLADWASEEETEPQHGESVGDEAGGGDEADGMAKAVETMKAHHAALGEAIKAYGDGAGLPAEHPLHALKALHKTMGDQITEKEAEAKEAAHAQIDAAFPPKKPVITPSKPAIPAAEPGAMVTKINKALVDLQKKLEATEKRAVDAEQIAKAERDLRELEGEKTTLRKFRHVTVDVDKEAALFVKLRTVDKPLYDLTLSKMRAAEAVAQKANLLETELGSPLAGTGSTAWAEIEAEAEKIVAKGETKMTKEKAIDRVMKARPDLVRRHKDEERLQVQ